MSRLPFRPFPSREPLHRRNGKIRAREVRVVDERAIDIVDYAIGTTTRVALDAWAPGLLAREAVVVPARDEVTAGMVVRAAVRVRDGRVPVRLGW